MGKGNENVLLVFVTVVPVTSMTSNISIGSELSDEFPAKAIVLEIKLPSRAITARNVRMRRRNVNSLFH